MYGITFTTPFSEILILQLHRNNPVDDYDWAVYNLTTATCAIIYKSVYKSQFAITPNLGCNGTTGPINQTAGPCGGQNNPIIPVTPGQTYVING